MSKGDIVVMRIRFPCTDNSQRLLVWVWYTAWYRRVTRNEQISVDSLRTQSLLLKNGPRLERIEMA
ncbi:MAG: hypothetical protein J07HQX50_02377 [Haloquadratum sp. J07HQX50]|nr:MAG: hypothetical protein J07HQX50_02377 [Haloquadratum sp. J07HQX50]